MIACQSSGRVERGALSLHSSELDAAWLARPCANSCGAELSSINWVLTRLRAGLEDTFLDDLLSAGGLRLSRIKLDRFAAQASGDTELEARERGVHLVMGEPSRVEVTGDARYANRTLACEGWPKAPPEFRLAMRRFVSGKRIAELIVTGKTPDLIRPFSIGRFYEDRLVGEKAAAAVSH